MYYPFDFNNLLFFNPFMIVALLIDQDLFRLLIILLS